MAEKMEAGRMAATPPHSIEDDLRKSLRLSIWIPSLTWFASVLPQQLMCRNQPGSDETQNRSTESMARDGGYYRAFRLQPQQSRKLPSDSASSTGPEYSTDSVDHIKQLTQNL
jgi:hypothetical protein